MTIRKFIPMTHPTVQQHLGFAHIALKQIADELMPDWTSFGTNNIHAENGEKSWNGVTPLHIGWVVEVSK